MAIRVKFLHLSVEKKMKYFQKSIDKYLELLVNRNRTNSHGLLFLFSHFRKRKTLVKKRKVKENCLTILFSKKEQKDFFEYLNSPRKPLK